MSIRIHIILLTILVLISTSCASGINRKKVSDLDMDQQTRLNDYLNQIDNCYIREINRLDDGVTDIRQIVELVEWKCKGHYSTVKNMLYKDFEIGLGYAYQFTEKMKSAGINKIAESLMAKRKITAKDPNAAQRRYKRYDRKQIEAKPFYDEAY